MKIGREECLEDMETTCQLPNTTVTWGWVTKLHGSGPPSVSLSCCKESKRRRIKNENDVLIWRHAGPHRVLTGLLPYFYHPIKPLYASLFSTRYFFTLTILPSSIISPSPIRFASVLKIWCTDAVAAALAACIIRAAIILDTPCSSPRPPIRITSITTSRIMKKLLIMIKPCILLLLWIVLFLWERLPLVLLLPMRGRPLNHAALYLLRPTSPAVAAAEVAVALTLSSLAAALTATPRPPPSGEMAPEALRYISFSFLFFFSFVDFDCKWWQRMYLRPWHKPRSPFPP